MQGPSSRAPETLAFLTTNAHTIGYQDNLQTLACVMRVLEEAEMAARTSLHNFRVVLTFGLLLVLFGSTLHLSSTGTQGKDAHLAKRSASLRGPAPDMNSTLPPLSLHQRVSAYSTTPKAPEDQLAVAFWNGYWYMRMMMGNEDDAETSFSISYTWGVILWANTGKGTTSNVAMRRTGGP